MLATMAKDSDPVSPDPIAKTKDLDLDPIKNRPDPVHCRFIITEFGAGVKET